MFIKALAVLSCIVAIALVVRARRRAAAVRAQKAREYAENGVPIVQFGKPIVGAPVFVKRIVAVPAPGSETCSFACGHQGSATFAIEVNGKPLNLKPEALARRELCPDCVRLMFATGTIPCGLCGEPIAPGSPTALYDRANDDGRFRDDRVTLEGSGEIVGCMGWDCCPSGGFFGGYWDGERFQPAFADAMSAGQMAIASGKMVTVNIGPDGASIKTADVPNLGNDDADDDK